MFCREQSARLGERLDEIEARDAQLIAIGNGHSHWGRAFVEAEQIQFPVFVDPGRHLYEHFGMGRGRSKVLNRRSAAHSVRATSQGFVQTATRGDPFQNGGVVVVDEQGNVVYEHVESVAGDLADLDEVIAALDA